MQLIKKIVSKIKKTTNKDFVDDPFGDAADQKLGALKMSIFNYITPGMIGVITGVLFIVGGSVEQLEQNFRTNVALNGAIIGMMIFAIIKAFFGNYKLWRTAKFMGDVDALAERGDATDQEVIDLVEALENRGELLNIKNMANAIENISEFGCLNFSDRDAMLIKSKFGYRVRNERGAVDFISGTLVMMGLLGTFLGLLKTIDAVGAALGSMGSLGSGEAGDDAMGGFITSLAAPLQGMGLAFSSSLFGLSGSLLIGYFNHLCANAQNRFIEDVSRWIDDRIPSLTPASKKAAKGPGVPAAPADLKPWLTGFVYLSVKTHQKMASLFTILAESVSHSEKLGEKADLLCAYNNEIKESLSGMGGYLDVIGQNSSAVAGQMEGISSAMGSVQTSVDVVASLVQQGSETNRVIAQNVETGFERTASGLASVAGAVEQNSKSGEAIVAAVQSQGAIVSEAIKPINPELIRLGERVQSSSDALKEQIVDQNQYVRTKMGPLLTATEAMSAEMNAVSALMAGADKVNKSLGKKLEKHEQSFARVSEGVSRSIEASSELNKIVSEHSQMLEQGLKALNQNTKIVNDNITGSVDRFGQSVEQHGDKFSGDISRMNAQFERMNELFEQMNKSQQELSAQVNTLKEAVQVVENTEQIGEVRGMVSKLVGMVQKLVGGSSEDTDNSDKG